MQAPPTISPERVVHLLAGWTERHGPLKDRLLTALRDAIDGGRIGAGTRLPAERALADALSVSRTTVVAAYSGLRSEAKVKSRQGSGTWIPDGDAPLRRTAALPAPEPPPASRRSSVFRELLEESSDRIELLGAHLPACAELDRELFASCAEELAEAAKTPGYLPFGYLPLRRAIAGHLTRGGFPTSEGEVLVTNGAQQAISLLAAHFLRGGDTVALENPTYITAIDVFAALGARVETLPVDRDGVRVASVASALARGKARLVYLVPTFHNPTGTVVPEGARRELARLADAHGVPLVEDDSLADLGDAPPPAVGSFSRGSVVTIGSLSKLFWGGLRVGWVRGDAQLLLKLARLRIVTDLGSSLPSQILATRLLARAEDVKRARRREAQENLDHLCALLSSLLPSWTFERPAGGLALWVRLPWGDANELAELALQHGVAIVPGSVASPDRTFHDHLRIPFVLGKDAITEGIARLARAWEAYGPPAARREASLEVMV